MSTVAREEYVFFYLPINRLALEMEKPTIAATCPKQVDLKSGKKYAYCTCGLSVNQPFCDGKHGDTEFRPTLFEVEVDETRHLCQCKQTATPPFCDGSHKSIDCQ
jgi:CDGSH-type Zn-finger protein